MRRPGGIFIQNVFEDNVCPIKNVLREENPQAIAHLNGLLDRRHLASKVQSPTTIFQPLLRPGDRCLVPIKRRQPIKVPKPSAVASAFAPRDGLLQNGFGRSVGGRRNAPDARERREMLRNAVGDATLSN